MSDSNVNNCKLCGKVSSSRCSWCRQVAYCGKEHQKQDWPRHKEECSKRKFEVETNESLGRHVVATEDIKADNILFKERPLVFGLKPDGDFSSTSVCLGCYRTADDQCCFRCGLPVCSERCSSQWFHAEFECRLFSEGSSNRKHSKKDNKPDSDQDTESYGSAGSKDNIRETMLANHLYVRCALLRWVDNKAWTEFCTLQSHADEREDIANLEKTTRVFDDIQKILVKSGHKQWTTVEKPDIHNILGIIETNAVDMRVFNNVEITCMFPLLSMMEHSCVPNIKFYFVSLSGECNKKDKKKDKTSSKFPWELYCRSAVKINKGDHLTNMYTHILWNTEKRREFLKKNKYFWCWCPRCADPFELNSNFSTIFCPLPDCRSLSVPVPKPCQSSTSSASSNPPASSSGDTSTNDKLRQEQSWGPLEMTKTQAKLPQEQLMQWQCTMQRCGKTCEPWQVKKVDSKLSELVGKTRPTIGLYQSVLSQMEELVHPDYYLTFVVNHSLVQMMGQGDLSANLSTASLNELKDVLEQKLTLCNRLLGTIKKLDPGFARLNIYAAVVYYEMHAAILKLAGGENDQDFKILRGKPDAVKLAKVYLQKCIDCYAYEFMDVPENRLKVLATKKLEYLNLIIK